MGLGGDEIAREFLGVFPDRHDPAATSVGAAVTLSVPSVPSPAPTPAATRLSGAWKITVGATPAAFARGRVLRSVGDRLIALGYDAAVVLSLGLVIYAVLGVLL